MLSFTLVLLSQIGSPQGVHLLDDAPLLLAQVAPPLLPSSPPSSEAQVSAAQLQVDLDALKKQRPGLGAGIALVTSGGTTALLGGLYLALSTAMFASVVNPLMVIGAIGLAIGLPLVVIGVWILYNRIEERNLIDEESKKLRKQLQQVRPMQMPQQRYAPPQPLPSNLPPPQVTGPDSAVYVAQF